MKISDMKTGKVLSFLSLMFASSLSRVISALRPLLDWGGYSYKEFTLLKCADCDRIKSKGRDRSQGTWKAPVVLFLVKHREGVRVKKVTEHDENSVSEKVENKHK